MKIHIEPLKSLLLQNVQNTVSNSAVDVSSSLALKLAHESDTRLDEIPLLLSCTDRKLDLDSQISVDCIATPLWQRQEIGNLSWPERLYYHTRIWDRLVQKLKFVLASTESCTVYLNLVDGGDGLAAGSVKTGRVLQTVFLPSALLAVGVSAQFLLLW